MKVKGDEVIRCDKLWKTMKDEGIAQYMLVKEYNVSKSLLHRLRNNQGVNMNTIDTLCDILDCDIEDITTHYNSEE